MRLYFVALDVKTFNICVRYTYLLVTILIWLNAVTFTLVRKINVMTTQT